MRLFAPKPPIDRDEFEWLLACFAWLRTVLDYASARPDFVLSGDPAIAAFEHNCPDLAAALDAVDLMQWRYD